MSDWSDDDLPDWRNERGSDLAVSTAGAPSATNEFSGDESLADLDPDPGPQLVDARVPLVRPRGPGRPATSTQACNVRRRERRAAARVAGSGVDGRVKRGVGRPRTGQSAAALRRNQLNDECKVAERAMRDVASKVPGAEAALTAALQTPGGRKAFPGLAKPYHETSTAQAVLSAVAGALSELTQPRAQNTKTKATAAAVAAAPASRGWRVSAKLDASTSSSLSSRSTVSGQTVKVGKPLPARRPLARACRLGTAWSSHPCLI
jgi:hypothetical protein